jgi:hypothetical protein
MTTMTTPPPAADREQAQRRVAHPLARLRGFIRFYVATEGLAVLLIYLALWFWIGLLLDYGAFKLFRVDWVQEVPHAVRTVILCGLVAGLLAVVAFKMLLRLVREFRSDALALVLERRFPTLLGDRLITAVEMADPRLAARYGYSQALIDQTVQEAALNVDQLPIGEAFNWRRLWRYAVAVALLSLGIYAVVAAAYAGYGAVRHGKPTLSHFVPRFNEVAGIWFERNVLLRDTIWPRRAHLELVDFPATGEMKIARDAPAPNVRVRAWEWVIADGNRHRAPEGWRLLLWSDLTPELLGTSPPALPGDWTPDSLTVDEVALRLQRQAVRESVGRETLQGLEQLLTRLDELAQNPSMSRRLRRLIVPPEVKLILKGASGTGEQTLQRRDNHEYSGTLTELKESVRLTARGEDYSTPPVKITLVPPPDLVELSIDEDEPAYLYQRPPQGGTLKDLRGLKQRFRNRAVSLTGERSSVEVPAGTDLVLKGVSDKDLQNPGGIRIVPQKGSASSDLPVEQVDNHAFHIAFRDLKQPVDLLLELRDTDNVTGQRHVVIKPTADQPPEVEAQIEVLRKTNQGYLCTPWALIPFSGKVRDDHGLSNVEYAYTVARVESAVAGHVRSARLASALVLGGTGLLDRLAMLAALTRPAGSGEAEEKFTEKTTRLDGFDRLLKERAQEELTPAQLQQALQAPVPSPQEINRRLLTDFTLDPDFEVFDVGSLGVEVTDDKKIQPHYRLRLRVTATDNNIETGPRSNLAKEQFTIMIVSEEELLAEIAKEEESLYAKLKDTVEALRDARTKLDSVAKDIPDMKPDEFSPATRRAEEFDESIVKGWNVAREVEGDYRRILKELTTNNGRPGQGRTGLITKLIAKVDDKICKPLEIAIDPEFPSADESMRDLQKKLDAKEKDVPAAKRAQQDLTKVIDRLNGVLDAMADMTSINDLINKLVQIRDREDEEYQRLKALKDKMEKDILGGDSGPNK